MRDIKRERKGERVRESTREKEKKKEREKTFYSLGKLMKWIATNKFAIFIISSHMSNLRTPSLSIVRRG